MALNDTSDLEDELRGSGDEYTDLDLNRYLRQANQKLAGMVGTQFIDSQLVRIKDQKDIQLAFNSLESFDKVVNQDMEVVDDSNYTVDLTTGVVSFTQSYADENIDRGTMFEFYYIPSLFKLLELKQAQELILSQETVVTSDEVTNTQVQRLEETIYQLMKDINSRNSGGIQRGDNQNRGSRVPDRYPD